MYNTKFNRKKNIFEKDINNNNINIIDANTTDNNFNIINIIDNDIIRKKEEYYFIKKKGSYNGYRMKRNNNKKEYENQILNKNIDYYNNSFLPFDLSTIKVIKLLLSL